MALVGRGRCLVDGGIGGKCEKMYRGVDERGKKYYKHD